MITRNRLIEFIAFALIAGVCLISCTEKKEGKVSVTDQSFSIRKDGKIDWVVDAKGKIRNVGEVDVKNVVVTAYCRSCGEVVKSGNWFISNLPKTPVQQDVINYLAAGQEAGFGFKEIAFYFDQGHLEPKALPEKLEVVIESFETVEGK